MRRVSVNIGTMQGGVKINMLPADCVLEVDFRLPVGISRAAVLARVAAIVARHPGVSFEELLPGGPEATVSDPTHEMMGHLLRHAGARLGRRRRSRSSASAAPIRASGAPKGVPAFVYGCSPAGMGGVDESVSIAEFHHVMRVHALAAWDYLSRP